MCCMRRWIPGLLTTDAAGLETERTEMTERTERCCMAGGQSRVALRPGGSLFLSVLSVLSVISVLSVPPLSAQSKRLDSPPFDRQLWGVAVVNEKGSLVYGRNPRQLFIPASNTKIVV